MDIRQILGNNVKVRRLEIGKSQEELAAAVGVDQAYVSRLEAGEQNATILTIWHVAQALESDVTTLLEDTSAS